MEGFFTKLTEMTDKGKKFIYIIDSYDGLMCAEDRKRRKEIQDAHNSGKEFKFQDFPRRAAFGHELCRNMVSDIAKTGSIIINISQAKEKLNATMFEDKKRRAGGTSLDYYTHVVFWLTLGATDKTTEGNVVIRDGHWVNFDITKNRVNGRSSKIKLYVRPEYGIDDIVSNIAFLESVNALEKEKRSFVIDQWGFKGTQDSLISFIEENNKEEELAKMVEDAWNRVIEKVGSKIERKKRYE
jgi:RecA/RadA recombinase